MAQTITQIDNVHVTRPIHLSIKPVSLRGGESEMHRDLAMQGEDSREDATTVVIHRKHASSFRLPASYCTY